MNSNLITAVPTQSDLVATRIDALVRAGSSSWEKRAELETYLGSMSEVPTSEFSLQTLVSEFGTEGATAFIERVAARSAAHSPSAAQAWTWMVASLRG